MRRVGCTQLKRRTSGKSRRRTMQLTTSGGSVSMLAGICAANNVLRGMSDGLSCCDGASTEQGGGPGYLNGHRSIVLLGQGQRYIPAPLGARADSCSRGPCCGQIWAGWLWSRIRRWHRRDFTRSSIATRDPLTLLPLHEPLRLLHAADLHSVSSVHNSQNFTHSNMSFEPGRIPTGLPVPAAVHGRNCMRRPALQVACRGSGSISQAPGRRIAPSRTELHGQTDGTADEQSRREVPCDVTGCCVWFN